MKTDFKQYQGKIRQVLTFTCISLVAIAVLAGCSSTPAPALVLTASTFEVLECPEAAYVGDYIVVSGRTTFKTRHELIGLRGGEGIYFTVFREESYPDTENVVRWYVQIPENTKIGVVTLEIRVQVESDRYKTVFSKNVTIKEPTSSVNPAPVPELPLSPTPVSLPAPPHYFPITDNFTIGPFDEEASAKYSGWFISQYPFNAFGGYANRFSFEENEVLDIVITSEQPISIEMCNEYRGGIYVDIQYMQETGSRASSNWYESYDIRKSGNNWEARIKFNPDETGVYSLVLTNRSGKSSWCQYTISLHTASSTKKINTGSEATTAVLDRLSSLATTSDAKQFLAEFQDNVWDTGFFVFDSEGAGYRIDEYQGQDICAYAVEFAFPEEVFLNGILGNEITLGWQGQPISVKTCSWLVEIDGTVRPRDNGARRVETELTYSTTLSWTYPELHQIGIFAEPDFFHETIPRETLENPDWNPRALEKRVTELAKVYEKAHPYVEPNHVCRHMAMELWQVLKDNDITSMIVVGNTEDQNEWLKIFLSNHVWLVVLGRDNLNLGVECTSGIVYSPSYMRAYELDCEWAYREYGTLSPQWVTAKAQHDKAYTDYEQHLEGYFHVSPANFLTSTILWFIP